jgi:hypothetical protein
MIPIAIAMRTLNGSSRTIDPNATAITGLTYEYSETTAMSRCLRA